MFTGRQYRILELLLNNIQGMNGEKIAGHLNVSSRTVRNEVGEINRIWQGDALIKASRKTGYYIREEDRGQVRTILIAEAGGASGDKDVFRRWKILGMVLESGRTEVEEICRELALSDAAVYKEMSRLQKHLQSEYHYENFHYNMESVWIDTDEKKIRQTLFKIIKNEMLSGIKNHHPLLETLLYQGYDQEEYDWMIRLIKKYFDGQEIAVSDANLFIISGAVYVTMIRNYQGHMIADDVEKREEPSDVLRFFDFLREQNFELNDADMELIGTLLYGFKLKASGENGEIGNEESRLVLEEFCSQVLEKYHLDLWQSQEFYDYMLDHMEYMLRRIDTGYTAKNPMLNDIKRRYPYAYEVSMLLVPIVYRYKNCYIQDDELCYIAIFVEHFLEKVNRKLKVVMIGSNRFSVNSIIHNWLKSNYQNHFEVLAILPMHRLEQFLKDNKVDLIVSTIDSFIHPEIETFTIKHIPDHYTQTALNALLYKIRKNYHFRELIKEIFHENTIRIYDEKKKFDEVIRELATALKEEEVLEDVESYVEDILLREVNYPTCVGDWFMIPHPLMNFAKKTAIAVAVLKKPIHMHDREIQLIFLLAMEQRIDDQIGVLFHFFKHMALEEASINMLSSVKTEREFIDTLVQISDFTEIS